MAGVQLAWNAIDTHREVVCFFFASPSPCADGKRECFREAGVENEGYTEGYRGQVEKSRM